ncbi:MAG: hypothetical protein IKL10_01300 [Clostridia bacterium]|nr:hypothetical protein [Clostridia bacterium]
MYDNIPDGTMDEIYEGGWLEDLNQKESEKVINFVNELKNMLLSVIAVFEDIFNYIAELF